MKKALILCLHRPNRSPSQRFRFEQYLEYLEQQGYFFVFSYLLSEEEDKIFYQTGHGFKKALIVLKSTWKRWKEMWRIRQYDLVFVQREAYMLGTAYFEKRIAKKRPLVFDFDDSIWMQNVSAANQKLAFLKDASKTQKIIKAATLVFAGNQYLADYSARFNKNVVIVPTTIDTDTYVPAVNEKKGNIVCIGWSGSFSTIQHFTTAIPALKRIKEKFGHTVSFKIIGDQHYYCSELETQGTAWNAATEIADLSGIDIGIMPLPDDEWAKGKCGLKGLQYMALGIPTLMSPVGVNSEIVQNGINGYLPLTEDDWVETLTLLIEDRGWRKKIGIAGRQTVIDKYSVKTWKEKYLYYFNQVCKTK